MLCPGTTASVCAAAAAVLTAEQVSQLQDCWLQWLAEGDGGVGGALLERWAGSTVWQEEVYD